MTASQRSGGYRGSSGTRHEVLVRRTETGDWEVLDQSPAGVRVVETLSAISDDLPQAQALAQDYLTTRVLAAAGHTRPGPIPQRGGADAHSDRHAPPARSTTRGAALSRPAS